MRKLKQTNLESLNSQELESLSEELGIEVRKIVDKAFDKANKLLKTYGLETKAKIVILPIGYSQDLKGE